MYNLVMSGWREAFSGEPHVMDKGRCVHSQEYTKEDISKRLGSLDATSIVELKRLPTILAYEAHCERDPHFARILDIEVRAKEVRITYEIQELEKFLTFEDLEDEGTRFALDLGRWEVNRSHWAVKDVDLARELSPKGIILPGWVRGRNRLINLDTHAFDVALSFPGEARTYVFDVAKELDRLLGPNRCFYDNNYRGQLARPSLDLLLQDIYGKRSKLIVVFIGGDYQKKDWCGIEWSAIREIISRRNRQRIMFVRLDHGDVEGVLRNDGYVPSWDVPAMELADMIEERVALLD